MLDLLALLSGTSHERTPHERDARRHLLDRFASVAAWTSGVLALIHLPFGVERVSTMAVLSLTSLGCLVARWQARRGQHRDASLLLTLIVLAGTTAALASGLGLRDGGTPALALVVVVGSLLVGRRRVGWVIALVLAAVALLAELHIKGMIRDEGPLPVVELVTMVIVLVAAALIAVGLQRTIELHLAEIRRADEERGRAYELTLEGWARVLELKDEETEGHSRRVTRLSVSLARAMGLDEERIAHVRRGALLHDIGKLAVPDEILRKPGPLSDAERAIMQRHPEHAVEMLRGIAFLEPALSIPHMHHERWDGSGYPQGLRGEQVPLEARLFTVVDVWEALTSDRPYRPAWPVEEANAYLRRHAGTLFDPAVVDAFLDMLARDPSHTRPSGPHATPALPTPATPPGAYALQGD